MSAPEPWRAVRTDDGSWTLAHPGHAATCHSLAGAWQQARERYAAECRLAERGRKAGASAVSLLDIGTGLGLNLAAALEALDGSGASLEATSLERDRGVLEGALALALRPETRAGPWEVWHACVREALAQALRSGADAARGIDLAGRGRLRFFLGDARETLAAIERRPCFDAVFLDPFAPRVEGELWQPDFLAEVAARMGPGALLSTYSASFPVRRALAMVGLEVGRGARVGRKSEGTLAGRGVALAPLSGRTARRLARAREGFSSLDRA